MASNVKEAAKYTDLTPAAPLSKADLNKMTWRSLQLQSAFNYERMQAAGWLWGILPGLEKIHTNKEDLAISMSHNMDFFNTHPYLVTFVMGIVLSLEQQKADIATIRSVRVAAMGPLGGIGDALFWYTFMPIVAGITATMAIDGSLVGPILYFVIAFGVQMVLRFWLMSWSYKLGSNAIGILTKNAKEFTRSASILGVFIIGAMVVTFGGTTTRIWIPNGDNPINLQGQLDTIFPKMLPFAITMLCYWLIKKKNFTPVKVILVLLVIGIVGAIFGVWAGDYTPLVDWYTVPAA
ncbi:PTS system N-acetylgalactosamine-specific IID component [Breznakia sp. PF5-3]|uniref:PTS system mannose/fructose/sorbose family transporter subunit IID n=1 Tax=unclassified Breznakia TaxID=2623764 RepID=UPI0024065F6D|nr:MULTISPECIES: PTS system mannose/fructose/sorbose family transporter subunit IID [unclassified Breznakia]MDL2276558.1 PTS system mannose/fructose/sorbose family transporter subunit IID [Breznakia sp. OttesenSCG-928-G09]MDF9825496.1 PTS system N-acetylgalactosamine-specific IID component [Breznakia sp. PM6-1]MDF9836342.1 PTS system N-acetylgalactosamine-specific IID component [Breznakia sp. PF5-3]MDF9838190.1 PTS system N-acetylgalactosamine-specific IID component [Breznakia sp. PFB2-8]MDF98